ncbi:hypothetical protein ACX0HA_16435 [Flavobacterium hauense]
MHSTTDILNILLKSIFVGFGFIMPVLALIKTSNLKALQVKDLFILTAVQAVRVSGILYFVLAFVAAYPLLAHSSPTGAGGVKIDFTNYAVYLLFAPIMCLIISQLFWLKKLYMKKAALITLSLLLLILPSDLFFAFAQSKDFMSSLKAMFTGAEILKAFISCVIFIFITFTIMLMGGKLKDKKA